MRQAGGADHQCQRNSTHVDHGLVIKGSGVGAKAKVDQRMVELVEQITGAIKQFTAQCNLGKGIAGHIDGNKHRRYGVGKDQHAILGDLGVGHTFHATQHGIDEHDPHAHVQAGLDGYFHEA